MNKPDGVLIKTNNLRFVWRDLNENVKVQVLQQQYRIMGGEKPFYEWQDVPTEIEQDETFQEKQ